MIKEVSSPTNPTSTFLKELNNLNHEWDRMANPEIYIGGMLTPLFYDIGVKLGDYEALSERDYMNYDIISSSQSHSSGGLSI